MLVLSSFNQTLILLLLFLLPNQLFTNPTLKESENALNIFINNIVKKVHKEKRIETLLLMKHSQDLSHLLGEGFPIELPVLRLNEHSMYRVRESFNGEALAVICMSQFADTLLLTTLVQNINEMRKTRILICLPSGTSNLQGLLRIFSEVANTYSLVNIIVLYSSKGSLIAYRMQPFPKATFEQIEDINQAPIFPKMWLNFKGKPATTLPDLFPPRSMLAKNPRTGEQQLFGSSDRLIIEFAHKYNITLRFLRPLSEVEKMDIIDVFNFTIKGLIDLPIRPLVLSAGRLPHSVEYALFLVSSDVFVVVPCGKQMQIGDVYTGLRTYSTIVLGSYFMFAIIETFIVAATYRIFRRHHFQYSDLIVNLRAFAGVLGMPMPLRGYRTSMSLQQIIMIMSIFSLVFTCFFNANLSTLLTKHPQFKQIQSQEELRASGISVLFDRSFQSALYKEVGTEAFKKSMPNAKFLPTKKLQNIILSLNTSYAYQMHSNMWNVLDNYQKAHNRIVLCKSPGLMLFKGGPLGIVLKKNSIFREAFILFVLNSFRYGFYKHWERQAGNKMTSSVHSLRAKSISVDNQEFKSIPFNMEDFNWFWKLLVVCYCVSTVVFFVEIGLDRWQKKRSGNDIIIM